MIGATQAWVDEDGWISTGRTFLADRGEYEQGTVHWYVRASGTEEGPYISSELTIRDCHRQVNLNFYFDDKEGLKERLGKIEILRNQLDKMENSLREAYEQGIKIHTKKKSEALTKTKNKEEQL